MFKDRIDAGYALTQRLLKYKNMEGVVLAVPKGGVPLGYVVASELGFPLELILSKKIGHPMHKEYAIGAASLWGSFVIPHPDVSQSYITQETARIERYLKQMQNKFMAGRTPADLKGKTVIVTDDGIATGNTLLATINMLKTQQPSKIIVAVPVSTQAGYDMLSKHCDELISVIVERQYFPGVGYYYQNFDDVSEEEVIYYLEENKKNWHLLNKV